MEQVEKDPDRSNSYIVPSTDKLTDGLGILRPEIHYDLSDYTKEGFRQAKILASHIIKDLLGAVELTVPIGQGTFRYKEEDYSFQGAGHLMGTYRMGDDPAKSVVDKDQRSWDHKNLFLVGDGVFPSTGTSNPSLTIAALSFRAGDTVANDLKAVTMQVQSTIAWQGTGVQVNGLVPRLVRYVSGLWCASPQGGNVDGNGGSRHIDYSSYALPGAAEGALIGRVGNGGKPFLVGDLGQVPGNEQGNCNCASTMT